ncbi:MAG TPA: glycosyltransferase [Flavipsychrobacter sp.]|nr:glycosyltransferase [Flavipsychrobacter sp.]
MPICARRYPVFTLPTANCALPLIFIPVLYAVLFSLFLLSVAIQCGYALYFFTRIFNFPKPELDNEFATGEVSIIICAKNEARNLENNLPAILSQRYSNETGKPMYEVVVVNDASGDDTEQVLYRLEQQFSHLWHVTIADEEERKFKGKKFALDKGVEYATHHWLLLTDADCVPATQNWIAHMVSPFEQGKDIVAGYGALKYHPGLLNTFIRWETLHTFVQYSTYALAGKPYMAVGRNLACTKEIFYKARQSDIWNELPSGDDDLLMQCCAEKDNTAIVAHRDAFTLSDAKLSWKEWIRQKQRHVSTGKYYRDEIQALLGVYAASHALSWLLFFVLIFFSGWTIVWIIMMMRCAVYWTIWQSTAFKLQDRKLLLWMPLCDIGWAIYNFVLSPYILWKNKQQWK